MEEVLEINFNSIRIAYRKVLAKAAMQSCEKENMQEPDPSYIVLMCFVDFIWVESALCRHNINKSFSIHWHSSN